MFFPDWNWVANGLFVTTIALFGGIFLRARYAPTMNKWNKQGGFARDWEACSPDTRVKVYVAACLTITAILAICFKP